MRCKDLAELSQFPTLTFLFTYILKGGSMQSPNQIATMNALLPTLTFSRSLFLLLSLAS
jgi:hypothetical protein